MSNQESGAPRGSDDRDKSDTTSTGKSGSARARTHDAAERLKSSAHEQIDNVKERASSGREHAAERIRRVGSAFRDVGRGLREQDEGFVARYADSLGERVDRVAGYVDSLEPRTLQRDATRLARSEPAWFFGGAFLLGLAAGRFLKSSAPRGPRYGDVERQQFGAPRPFVPPPAFDEGIGANERVSTRGVFDSEEGAAT